MIKQLKLEKTNSRAYSTQNEELKKIIIKIGFDLEDKSVVQNILQSVKSEIQALNKKVKLPTREYPIAAKVAQVGIEKEQLLQILLTKDEELSKLKEMNDMLQKKIDSHVCYVVVSLVSKDLAAKLTQVVITKLNLIGCSTKNSV